MCARGPKQMIEPRESAKQTELTEAKTDKTKRTNRSQNRQNKVNRSQYVSLEDKLFAETKPSRRSGWLLRQADG